MLYFVCFGISLYTEPQTFHLGSGANVMLSTQNHACFPGRDFICIYIYISHFIKLDTGSKLPEKSVR